MQRNKVFVTVPTATTASVRIENHEWLTIEGNLGRRTLSQEVRQHLLEVTKLYATSLRAADSVKPLNEVLRRIDDWKRQTNNLRSFVWKKSEPEAPDSVFWGVKVIRGEIDLDKIQEQFLCNERTEVESQFPLALLDRILKGSVELSRLVQHELRSDSGSSDDRNLWFLWAALVFSILRNAEITVRNADRKRRLLNGPVYLLARLQSKLPHELQLRKIPDVPQLRQSDIPESFRKGAVIAYKIRKGNPTESLQRMLARWVQGDFRTGVDQLDSRILKRFRRLTAS